MQIEQHSSLDSQELFPTICDNPLQIVSKVGINFLNKISFNLLKTRESKRFSIFIGRKSLNCLYLFHFPSSFRLQLRRYYITN